MLSKARLERYRRMTPAERWRETSALMEYAWQALMQLPYEERERRLAVARRQHRLSNDALAKALR